MLVVNEVDLMRTNIKISNTFFNKYIAKFNILDDYIFVQSLDDYLLEETLTGYTKVDGKLLPNHEVW